MSGFLAPAVVETPRLRLRAFRPEDHPAYAVMYADPEVMRFIGAGGPLPADACWRSMAAALGHWQLRGYGLYAVARREDDGLIGHVGFIDPPGWPGFELGWLLGREHWGHGFAREAAAAALRIAREVLRRDRVISLVRPDNHRSARLAEALGARDEGTVTFMGGPTRVFVHAAAHGAVA